MGIIQGASPIPETYAGPAGTWWSPQKTGGVVYLDRDVSVSQMLVDGGMDWTASKRTQMFEDMDGQFVHKNPGFVAMARDTDNAYLGEVTDSYHVFQFSEMGEMVDKVLELEGGLHCHTGGTLYGGRLGWLLAKFDQSIHVKGDGSAFESYLGAITGHDGRHALTFFETDVRIICGNTADAAIKGSSNKVSLRHTSKMADRTAEVQRALNLIVKHRENLEDFLNTLADKPMTLAEFKGFTDILIPLDGSKDSDKQVRTQKKRDTLVDLFVNSTTLDGIVSSSAYRAYQAVTEYADHAVDYRTTKRMSGNDRAALAIFEGSAYTLKSRAAALLVKA